QVPTFAATGTTFARFRLSTAPNVRPNGAAPDGEVEDYRLQIFAAAADLAVTASVIPDPIPTTSNAQGILTINNDGPSPAFNVVLSNSLPNVDILGGVPGTTCVVQPGGIITCNLGDLQPGEVRMIQFDFKPRPPSLITNTAWV